ncbi:hypothetical protein RAG20_26580, partial [Klebsiella pneumoniae]
MQMTGICVCLPYADARHMDMLCISCFLIFPPQIRKLPKAEVTKEGANKQVISSQADSLIKISRIWA